MGRLALVSLILTICVACGGNVEPELNYKPEYLPVELSIGQSGISIKGDSSLVTPIGTFSIGARYALPPQSGGSIYVILRNHRTGYDHIFEVRSGANQFMAVVNGTTSISIANDQVLIDVTDGSIKEVAFKRVNSRISEQTHANWFQNEWHKSTSRWNRGWTESWYKPYALTRWAYSDSTINKWYGIGFAWFLLRLVLAILMAIVDTVLSMGFLLGQIGYIIFGQTGRDVIYGLLVLGTIVIVGATIADSY